MPTRFHLATVVVPALLLSALSIGCGTVMQDLPAQSASASGAIGQRMAALRVRQHADGYDFASSGGVYSARIGSSHRVSIVADQASISSGRSTFAMQTTRIGRRWDTRATAPLASTSARGQEVVIDRVGVLERFLAGPQGLTQSWEIPWRPKGLGELTIEVSFDGLTPVEAGREVVLRDRDGSSRASYRELSAIDANGKALASHVQIEGRVVQLIIDDSDAVYPVLIDPWVVVE